MSLRILSVGEGDLTIKFSTSDKAEKLRGAKLVKDLLRQGYAIMVEVGRNEKGPLLQRVTKFDPETCEYIVMGEPDKIAEKRVSFHTPSVAVARTAGGYDPLILDRIRHGADPREVSVNL